MNRIKAAGPVALVVLAALAMALHGPIHQLAHYHEFADHRILLGVPNAGDVFSNAGFAIVGLWGLWAFRDPERRARLGASWPGYALFLVALLLTAAGSTWYHLAPDDARLVWDRLPIALACAGLLAAVHAETHAAAPRKWLTAELATAAVASVLWWSFTAHQGDGDLRPYLLLQGAPLVLIPLWQAMAGAPREDRIAFGLAILLYAIAKAAELADHALFDTLGVVSGHTLKHLLAVAASAVIVARIVRRDRTAAEAPRMPGSTRAAASMLAIAVVLACAMPRAEAAMPRAHGAAIDFSSTAGLEATCPPLLAKNPAALSRDDERVAFAICSSVELAKDAFRLYRTLEHVPGVLNNLSELRSRLEEFLPRITKIRLVLERVHATKPLFVIEPGNWEIDFDGDGRISPFERHLLWVPKRKPIGFIPVGRRQRGVLRGELRAARGQGGPVRRPLGHRLLRFRGGRPEPGAGL